MEEDLRILLDPRFRADGNEKLYRTCASSFSLLVTRKIHRND